MENVDGRNHVWAFVIIGFLSLLTIASYSVSEH